MQFSQTSSGQSRQTSYLPSSLPKSTESTFVDVLIDKFLKLVSVDYSLFVLVETRQGRRFAGADHLCREYNQSGLRNLGKDLDLRLNGPTKWRPNAGDDEPVPCPRENRSDKSASASPPSKTNLPLDWPRTDFDVFGQLLPRAEREPPFEVIDNTPPGGDEGFTDEEDDVFVDVETVEDVPLNFLINKGRDDSYFKNPADPISKDHQDFQKEEPVEILQTGNYFDHRPVGISVPELKPRYKSSLRGEADDNADCLFRNKDYDVKRNEMIKEDVVIGKDDRVAGKGDRRVGKGDRKFGKDNRRVGKGDGGPGKGDGGPGKDHQRAGKDDIGTSRDYLAAGKDDIGTSRDYLTAGKDDNCAAVLKGELFDLSWVETYFGPGNFKWEHLVRDARDFSKGSHSLKVLNSLIYKMGRVSGYRLTVATRHPNLRALKLEFRTAVAQKWISLLPSYHLLRKLRLNRSNRTQTMYSLQSHIIRKMNCPLHRRLNEFELNGR